MPCHTHYTPIHYLDAVRLTGYDVVRDCEGTANYRRNSTFEYIVIVIWDIKSIVQSFALWRDVIIPFHISAVEIDLKCKPESV